MRTEVFGKWILAGEHAVLRGSPALVFPVFGRSLKMSYIENGHPLNAEFSGGYGSELQMLFWTVWEKALELSGKPDAQVTGLFTFNNSIPIGAGMGASASICVALARWLVWRGWLSSAEIYEFARRLENMFHGESSGVDIAVALSGRGLYFLRDGERRELMLKWTPQWYLSYSGQKGATEECVRRVKKFLQDNPDQAEQIDLRMKRSVIEAEQALASSPSAEAFLKLASAIDHAGQCFENWGLTGGLIGEHMQMLRQKGAFAVKPTGSGNGGFVLSLWKDIPPQDLMPQLINLA